MAIDPRIALGVQPMQFENPVNQLAKVLQIKDMQQSGQMNALKMQEYQRGLSETNALNDAYRGALGQDGAVDRTKLFQSLATGGMGSKIPDLQKKLMEVDEKKAGIAKTEVDTKYRQIETAHKRVDLAGQTMGWLRQNPSLENAQLVVNHLVSNGGMDQAEGQGLLAQLQANPQGIAQFAEMTFRSALAAKDQLAKFQTNNIGGQTVTQQIDPVTGRASVASAITNTQSPDAQLQAQTSEANNRRSVGAQYDLNKATREAAQTNAQATREAAQIRRDQDTEMKLADDYRAQSKPFKEVSDAYKIITTSLDKATTSPAATLAGATKFMKLLDPGSVVRESELGMALAASGVFDRATNYVNTLRLGRVLTPNQAQDFKNIAGQIYQAAQQQQQLIDKDFRAKADAYKLRGDMVVQDLGQNKTQPVDIGSLPSGKSKVINFGDLK
jgi:hypothetical protein